MDFKRAIKELIENSSSLFAVHYSCQNLSDSNEGYSPRITSIAVLHIEHSIMHSFSIHLIAEENHVEREKLESCYDSLEGEMLGRFYAFVLDNPDARWIHWNMSNINYGFETLSHRYRVLTGKDAPRIPDARRYNLSTLIMAKYGSNCVDDPKMANLMDLNGGKHRDFLRGIDEVKAFQDKEFIKLHKSTMSKTYWFQKIYLRLLENSINTQRSNWKARVNRALESLPAKILGFIAVLFTVGQLIYLGIQNTNNGKGNTSAHQEQAK
ncbi:MAG: hypothetical protein H6976_10870 [Gammaproteobacteria bacterium]|nr:hypothetical protein [Gammaproteobacteria bacterium]